jgi:quercetin dioxygenase-like cupin family protein
MQIHNIKKFTAGWFIGNFEPSIFQNKDFEVCVKTDPAGHVVPPHYQKTATEYNYIIRGKVLFDNKILETGDIFVVEPGEWFETKIIEETELLVIKTPGVNADDKVLL